MSWVAIGVTAVSVGMGAYQASQTPDGPHAPSPDENALGFYNSYRLGNIAQMQQFRPSLAYERMGRMDLDRFQNRENIQQMLISANKLGQQRLDINRKFAPQEAELGMSLLGQVDPGMLATRGELQQNVLNDLSLGTSLSQPERTQTIEAVRGAQAARGNLFGPANEIQEAMELQDTGERRYQQRLSNATAALQLPRMQDLYSGLANAYNPLPASQTGFRLFNPGVGVGAAQVGAQYNSTGANLAIAGMNQPNPWMQGLGTATGAIGQYYGGRPVSSGPVQMPYVLGPGGQNYQPVQGNYGTAYQAIP